MKHTSVHAYLNEKLLDVDNPSNELILKLKKDYWKLYYRHYRQQRRMVRKEFTLGLDRQRLMAIENKKGSLSTSEFLYLIVDRELQSKVPLFKDKEHLSQLSQQLMKLIALVEELLDDERPESISDILDHLDTLEASFSQFINQKI